MHAQRRLCHSSTASSITFMPSHARPSSDAASVHRRRESIESMSVANVTVHASMTKDDILAFNVTPKYT